jgi:RHS repeat-associated protein
LTTQAYETSWTYDWLGRLKSISYPEISANRSGGIAIYEYGPSGLKRLQWCSEDERGSLLCPFVIRNVQYDAMGSRQTVTWGNGLQTRAAFTDDQRLRELGLWTTSALLENHVLSHTADGNVRTIVSTHPGGNVCERGFSYDYAGRLTGAAEGPAAGATTTCPTNASWTYRYNAAGNLTFNSDYHDPAVAGSGEYLYGSRTVNGLAVRGGPHAVTLVRGASNGVLADEALTYDANGAMTVGVAGTITYDYEGRIRSAQRLNALFGYDALGTRVVRRANRDGLPEFVRYYWKHFERRDHKGQASFDRYILVDGRRVATISDRLGDQARYIHSDGIGSTVLTTTAVGAIASLKRYTPLGSWHLASGSVDLADAIPYGFTGQEEELGQAGTHAMIRLGVRQYAQRLGRMTSPDTLIPNLSNPQSLNRYTYAYNNPVRFSDTTGYSPDEPMLTVNQAGATGISLGGMRVMMDAVHVTGQVAARSAATTAAGASIPLQLTSMATASAEELAAAVAKVSSDLDSIRERARAIRERNMTHGTFSSPGGPPRDVPSGASGNPTVPSGISDPVGMLDHALEDAEEPGRYIHQPRGPDGRFKTFPQRQFARSPFGQAIPLVDKGFDVYNIAVDPSLKTVLPLIVEGLTRSFVWGMVVERFADPNQPCIWGNPCY